VKEDASVTATVKSAHKDTLIKMEAGKESEISITSSGSEEAKRVNGPYSPDSVTRASTEIVKTEASFDVSTRISVADEKTDVSTGSTALNVAEPTPVHAVHNGHTCDGCGVRIPHLL
jgi:hypothetical protein